MILKDVWEICMTCLEIDFPQTENSYQFFHSQMNQRISIKNHKKKLCISAVTFKQRGNFFIEFPSYELFKYTHLPKYSFCRNIDEFFCTQYSDKQLGDDHRKLY